MKNEEKNWNNLTLQQQAFIDYYLGCFNATEAAIKAGYKESSASVMGARLFKQFNHIIGPRIDEIADARIMNAKQVLMKLSDIANGNEKDAFGLDVSNQDKLKALELLGKNYQLYTDKIKTDLDMDINVNLVGEDKPMLNEGDE